jgi:hypothetical protein
VRFFFRERREAYARLDEESLAGGGFRQDLYPVRFLPAERLNDALYELLLDFGHPSGTLAFVRSAGKIFPVEGGRDPEDRWQHYYTPGLLRFVHTRERLLFALFPQYASVDAGVHV